MEEVTHLIQWLCPECSNETFEIAGETEAKPNVVMFVCARCRTGSEMFVLTKASESSPDLPN